MPPKKYGLVSNISWAFLGPPVQFAWWAHTRRFLSVRPAGLDQKSEINNSYLGIFFKNPAYWAWRCTAVWQLMHVTQVAFLYSKCPRSFPTLALCPHRHRNRMVVSRKSVLFNDLDSNELYYLLMKWQLLWNRGNTHNQGHALQKDSKTNPDLLQYLSPSLGISANHRLKMKSTLFSDFYSNSCKLYYLLMTWQLL